MQECVKEGIPFYEFELGEQRQATLDKHVVQRWAPSARADRSMSSPAQSQTHPAMLVQGPPPRLGEKQLLLHRNLPFKVCC